MLLNLKCIFSSLQKKCSNKIQNYEQQNKILLHQIGKKTKFSNVSRLPLKEVVYSFVLIVKIIYT